MVSAPHLRAVVDLVDSAVDPKTRVAAASALVQLDLDDDAWRSVGDSLNRLLDDPVIGPERRGVVDALLAAPLLSVQEHVEHVADDPQAPGHAEALDAMAWTSPRHAIALAQELITQLGTDLSLIKRIAELPIENAGIALAQLRPALASADISIATHAAIAAGRLGDYGTIDDVLASLQAGDVPDVMHADPWSAYGEFCDVRPVPEPFRQHLISRLAAMADPSRECELYVWAITGIADAEGNPIVDWQPASPADPTPVVPTGPVDSRLVNAAVTTLTRSAFDEAGRPTVDHNQLNAVRAAAPDVAARLVENIVGQAVRCSPELTMNVGNSLMWIVDATPAGLALPVVEIAGLWRTNEQLPTDQLEWVLGRASDDALLDALDHGMDVTLLRDALAARQAPLPIRGAGPGGPSAHPRRATAARVVLDAPPAAAERAKPPEPAGFTRAKPPVRGADEAMAGDDAAGAAEADEAGVADAATDGADAAAEAPMAAMPAEAPPPPPVMAAPPTMALPSRSRARGAGVLLRKFGFPKLPMRLPRASRRSTTARPAAAPPVDSARHLNVDILDAASNKRREHSFIPGAKHLINVHIGPAVAQGLTVETAFPDARVRRDPGAVVVLDVQLIAESAQGTTQQRQQMLLPAEGPTAVLPFTLDVALEAREVRFSVLVFQGVRLLQSAEIDGPVSKKDAPVGGRSRAIRSTSELETEPVPVPAAAEVDLSLSFHVGGSEEALANTSGKGTRMVSLAGLDGLTRQVTDVLRDALGSDDVDGAKPGSEQQTALLRQLAQLGNALYQQLESKLGDLHVTRGVQVTTADDQVVPVEVVYDYGFPSETAKLCANWKKALKTGACTCKPRDGEVKTVCPLGFWGVRLTIERQLSTTGTTPGHASPAGSRRADALELPALDRVLFAASAKVDGVSSGERERTITALRERLGDKCVTAETWPAWRTAIRKHHPGLLLALPHNEAAENGLPMLQIGSKSTVHVGALTPDYVVRSGADAVGPVVLLLGCNTAVADVPWQSAADAFRRHGAAVVIGTLAETLGRQTAPMARLLADALWGPHAVKEQTMGEVMRSVRCRLLLQGATLGMSLVAFGHAGWLVPAPVVDAPPKETR